MFQFRCLVHFTYEGLIHELDVAPSKLELSEGVDDIKSNIRHFG